MMEQIFGDEPVDWGLRGDPYLWKDLCKYMTAAKEPADVAEFEELFYEAYTALTGEPILSRRRIFVEKYSFGGMSSGYIDPDFWLNKGFPLLKERFIKLKQ